MNHRLEMKAENQRRILQLINKRPSFRAAIAAELGLTQAAVSQLVDELIGDGVLIPAAFEPVESGLGRRPELLDICSSWGTVIGVSIDRERVTVGAADLKGKPLTDCVTLPVVDDCIRTLDGIAATVKHLMEEHAGCFSHVLGVGVAVPGPMDAEAGTILEPPGFPQQWYNLPLKKLLEERLALPVYLEHNSRAFAQAEICLGRGAQYSHFLILNINAGIGSGLVLNGEVYTGAHGVGCEIGHTTVEPNGRICFCGKRGCLEQYASATALLHEVSRIRKDISCWSELVDKASGGDDICDRFLSLEASYFGNLVGNLMSFCDLEAVFFTGQIAYRGEYILGKIREEAGKNIASQLGGLPDIQLSAIPGNPYLASAAAVVIYKLYYQPLFYYEKNQERKAEG